VGDLRRDNPALLVYPACPRRRGRLGQLLLKVVVIPLQGLQEVPVIAGLEGGEGLSRVRPPPEEVDSECANETRLVVPMAERRSVLNSIVQVRFAYVNISKLRHRSRNGDNAYPCEGPPPGTKFPVLPLEGA
jgi:hypothetical protein